MSFMNNIDKGNNMTKQTSTAIEQETAKQETAIKFGNYGWICPVCGRGNSPFTTTCICRPVNTQITCGPGRYIYTLNWRNS